MGTYIAKLARTYRLYSDPLARGVMAEPPTVALRKMGLPDGINALLGSVAATQPLPEKMIEVALSGNKRRMHYPVVAVSAWSERLHSADPDGIFVAALHAKEEHFVQIALSGQTSEPIISKVLAGGDVQRIIPSREEDSMQALTLRVSPRDVFFIELSAAP